MKRNLTYKLLALAVSILIWAYAGDRQSPTVYREELRNVPLELRGVVPGLMVAEAPANLRVILEGPRSYVASVVSARQAVTAYVDLEGKAAGRHTLPVSVKIPEGYVSLVAAHAAPREVTVTLESSVQRTLRIDVQFADTPPVGYKFSPPQISPERAVVSGRSALVNRITQVVVAIDNTVANLPSIDGEFPLIALDRAGKPVRGVNLVPDRAHLLMELLEEPASREVFVSLDAVGQPAFPYKVAAIEVQPQTVTVTGRPEQLVNVTTLKTEPVQLANQTKTFTQRVRVVPPPGLTIVNSEQVRVTVRIEPAPPGTEVGAEDSKAD